MKINKNWQPKEFRTGIINPETGKEWILSDYYEDETGNRYFTHEEAMKIWDSLPDWGPCTNEFHKVLGIVLWDYDRDVWTQNALDTGLNGFEYITQKLGYELGGFHPKDNDVLLNVGYCGDSWSSAMSGIYSQCLYFSPENLKPSNISLPAHGLQVRCLKEEPTRKYLYRESRHIHEYCKGCRTYLLRDWTSGKYDCRFADVCNERKRYLAFVNDCQVKAVEAFKRMCPFQDGRCRPNCEGCARLNQFIQKLNE